MAANTTRREGSCDYVYTLKGAKNEKAKKVSWESNTVIR